MSILNKGTTPKKKLVQKSQNIKDVLGSLDECQLKRTIQRLSRMTYNELACGHCARKVWPYKILNFAQLPDIFPICRGCALDVYLAQIAF